MDQASVAWAAGLFEGEGSICPHRTKRPGGDTRDRSQMLVTMCDEAVVRRFHEVIGVGTVSGPQHLKNRQSRWTWRCSKKGDLQLALLTLMPWLSGRRKAQATRTLIGDSRFAGAVNERE